MKKILVITTGGTIAMKKDRETGGLMPAVSGKDLAAAVPGLAHYADLDVLEFSNKPSGWMTAADMFELSKLIDRLADTDQADGFVITHGTDTLEETAFFLEAVLKTEKPVCVTGAMRGASALSADGPANILASVRTAASDDSIGKAFYEFYLLRYRSVFVFCLLSRDKGKECNGGKKEHTCDTGGKKLIAKEFGSGLVAYKKKAEESPVV
jgi:L-asparaginase/Glu-tRNA(Gln) amidotransferase subunit D